MTTATAPTITLPGGVYAIADPCALISDSDWMEWDVLHRVNPDQQSFTLADGSRLVVLATDHGDGWYFDQDDFSYAVDSGFLSIRLAADVPADVLARLDDEDLEWVEPSGARGNRPLGRILRWDAPFCVARDGARLLFGDLVIDTGWRTPAPATAITP